MNGRTMSLSGVIEKKSDIKVYIPRAENGS
jgi:hypothetical protein